MPSSPLKKIVVIEDDTALLTAIRNYLRLNGFEVYTADNGAQGIQLAFRVSPDVILCDINLPGVDGYQVFRVLNEAQPTFSIPFIFITSRSSLNEIRAGLQLGADDYIVKPFQFDDLLQTIAIRTAKRDRIVEASEEKFTSLFDNSPNGVFICQNNRFVRVNRKAAGIFGLSQVAMLDQSLTGLISEPDRTRLTARMNECLLHHLTEFHIEVNIPSKRSTPVPAKIIGGYTEYRGTESIIGCLVKTRCENTADGTDVMTMSLRELGLALEAQQTGNQALSKTFIEKLRQIYTREMAATETIRSQINLSEREFEVLSEICKGKSSHEISDILFISERTIEKHRAAIVSKTGSKNMIEAVIYAIRHQLIVF
jgi:PAS domain S-box-containing protein